MTCPSVNVTYRSNTRLEHHPCTLDAGHHGDCISATGLRWTRLGELLQRLGLELAGHHTRKAPPHDHDE